MMKLMSESVVKCALNDALSNVNADGFVYHVKEGISIAQYTILNIDLHLMRRIISLHLRA